MTDDAMHWVWKHSKTRGNARLALLAIADAVTDHTATVAIGTTELIARVNAARSTTLAAVADALETGELEITSPGAGRRATEYRIPGAADYVRASGPNLGPLETRSGPNLGPQTLCGPNLRPQTPQLAVWISDHKHSGRTSQTSVIRARGLPLKAFQS